MPINRSPPRTPTQSTSLAAPLTLLHHSSSELDYVTTRKPQQANSLDNLFVNNSTLLDTTMTSLPNTSMIDNDTITNLNETIRRLTLELQSAHQEIEDLNSENFRLKWI